MRRLLFCLFVLLQSCARVYAGEAPAYVQPAPLEAPVNATYITQTANGTLTAEQALAALATGLLKVTTGTGVLSTATAGTDYIASVANPTATIGLSAVNGSASTALRSDGAPALSQSITPTWTGDHQFNGGANALTVGAITADTTVDAAVGASSATQTPFMLQGAAAQSAPLFKLKDSANTVVMQAGPDGKYLAIGGITSTDTRLKETGNGLEIRNGDDTGYSRLVYSDFYAVYDTTATISGGWTDAAITKYVGVVNKGGDGTIQIEQGGQFAWGPTGNQRTSAADLGMERLDAAVMAPTNGSTGNGWLQQQAGRKIKSADQTVTDSATLVNDTHLTFNLLASRKYSFIGTLFCTSVATSGVKFAWAGTATVTNIIFSGNFITASAIASAESETIGTAVGSTALVLRVDIAGTFEVNGAGTFLLQFAQNAETGAAESITLQRGSSLWLEDVP